MHLGESAIVWSSGRLVLQHVRSGQINELDAEKWTLLRQIDAPLTGYVDGSCALEHCEAFLSRLRPKSAPRIPIEATNAPKPAVQSSGKGVPKRPIFAGGSFVVAVGSVEDLPKYAVHVLREPDIPRAFRTRKAAERWWTKARRAHYLSGDETPLVLEVVRRFELALRLPTQVDKLLLPQLIETLRRFPEMVTESDLRVRYVPRHGEPGDARRRTMRNRTPFRELANELLDHQERVRDGRRRAARDAAVCSLRDRHMPPGGFGTGSANDPVTRAFRLLAPSEACRVGLDCVGLIEPPPVCEGLSIRATWRTSTPRTGKTSLNYRCELVVPDLTQLLQLGGRRPELWIGFTEGAVRRGGATRPRIWLPVCRHSVAFGD